MYLKFFMYSNTFNSYLCEIGLNYYYNLKNEKTEARQQLGYLFSYNIWKDMTLHHLAHHTQPLRVGAEPGRTNSSW